MNTFLNDTENVLIQKRISNLIEQQLPSFIQEEGPEFIRFLKTYFEWSELHELTVSDVNQFEYRFFTENDDNFLTENDEIFILESERTDDSAFIEGEIIEGQESGAVGTIDRNTFIYSNKIYVKNLTRIDFIPNEIIKGVTSRVEARVDSFFKNPMFGSRSLLKNIDLNTSSSKYINLLFNQFMTDFDVDLASDKSHVIKHIVDVYRSKGSNISFDFLFKTLYNEQNLIFYTPKEDIFKLSSGQWVSNKLLRIQTSDPITHFEGRKITGRKSLSTAIVDRIDRYALGNIVVTELYLINPQGNFVIGENVRTNTVDNVFGEGEVKGVVTDVEIINPGTNYVLGDILTITGGGGLEATARVSEIASGILTDFQVLDGGDAYTLDSELTVNNFGTRGSGFAGRISEVQNAYTFHFNNDYIFDHASTFLDAYAYNMSGDPTCNISCRLVDALGFIKLNAGPISSIKTLVIGTGYESEPTITVTENDVLKFSDDSGVLILNLNSDPDNYVFTPAITGSFKPSERIHNEDGTKIGTFFGLVFDTRTELNPSRMRMKTSQYLGIYGVGANDLTLDNSGYINPNNPTIYDVRVSTGGKLGNSFNNFQFRRGLKANDENIDDADLYTDIEYTEPFTDMTADFQTLKFNIDSIEKSGTDAIVTTTYKNGLESGINVNVSGADDDFYNGIHEITVINDYSFKYTVDSLATTPVTGNLYYDEGIQILFRTPYNHDVTDRYLLSTVDFASNEIIIGYDSGAIATVNTGSAFSPNIDKGENAKVRGLAEESQSGAIGAIEITNFGIGYSTVPSVTATHIGSGNAVLRAKIGTIADSTGKYFDENGFLSFNKRIFDGYYYQDYSYVLKNKIQFNEYEQILKKLIHPAGTKMFGEYIVQADDLIFSFDNFITYEDGFPIYIEDGNNERIIAEQYFEPNHDIEYYRRKEISKYGSGTLVTIQGGNNIITAYGSTQKLSEDFVANSAVIIDDEQKFLISFGELKLDNYYKGKISTDSQNVISRIVMNNPVFYTKENLFITENNFNMVLEDGYSLLGLENYKYNESSVTNFRNKDIISQRKSNGHVVTSTVFKTELDNSNNKVILVYSSNSFDFDLNSNIYTNTVTTNIYNLESNLIFSNSYEYDIPKLTDVSYDTGRDIILKTEVNHLLKDLNRITIRNSKEYDFLKIYDGNYNIKVIDDKTFKITVSFSIRENSKPDFSTFSNADIFLNQSSDFQNDFKVGDVITFNNNDLESEVLSIVNSSCISLATRITSDRDDSYNLITESYYGELPIVLEDNTNLILNYRESDPTSYDNKNYESHLILEPTVRGYTTANGLSDGRNTLIGVNTKFHLDLLVDDIIALSSRKDLTSKIVQINDFNSMTLEDDSFMIIDNSSGRLIGEDSIDYQELVLSKPLGNGDPEQSFILYSSRNLDLEVNDVKFYLNLPYDGSNNYIRVNDSSTIADEGLLLLDDGVGFYDPRYVGNVSTEGKLLFESNTTFNGVGLKIETKY